MTPEEKEVVWRVLSDKDILKRSTRILRLSELRYEANKRGDVLESRHWMKEVESEKSTINSLLDSL